MTRAAASHRYHHGDLANALLDAAQALLVEKGLEALSLREAARRAGVSHAAPYRHFRDRAGLIRALAADWQMRLADAMRAAAKHQVAGPERRLAEAAVAYVKTAAANPAMRQLAGMGDVTGDGRVIASHPVADVLVEIIGPGIQTGVFRTRDVMELVRVVWSALHGIALLGEAGGEFLQNGATETRVRTLIQHIVYGISK